MKTAMLSAMIGMLLLGGFARPAEAVLVTVYQENFNTDAGDGVTGPVPPNSPTFDNGNWSVDATGASFTNASEFAKVETTAFRVTNAGNVVAGTPGTVVFLTAAASLTAPGNSFFTSLTASLSMVTFGNFSGNDTVLIESLVDGNVVGAGTWSPTDMITGNVANTSYTQNLLPFVGLGTNYQIRVTFTQNDASSNAFLDNILVQGNAVPEPASLAMLGMGVCSMFGAGYRRRRRQSKKSA